MRQAAYIFFALVLFLAVSACAETEYINTAIDQEKNIDKYIETHYPDSVFTIVRNGGAIRVLMEEGEGEPVAKGDSAVFNYSGYIFSGSPSGMFAQGSYTALLGKGDLVPGLDAGIEGMKKGEQSLIFFSARYGFYNDAVSVVPKMSALVYNITLNDIIVKK